MPITLYEKVNIHIDTTKYSRDVRKDKVKPEQLELKLKALTNTAEQTTRKYSRTSRRRNG